MKKSKSLILTHVRSSNHSFCAYWLRKSNTRRCSDAMGFKCKRIRPITNLVISRKNRSKTFAWLRQANMICPGPSEIYPAPLLFLSKHTRKFKKRKKRKKNGEKKRALRKTRIYNYYVPTKRSRCKAQVTPHCGEARWRRCGSGSKAVGSAPGRGKCEPEGLAAFPPPSACS